METLLLAGLRYLPSSQPRAIGELRLTAIRSVPADSGWPGCSRGRTEDQPRRLAVGSDGWNVSPSFSLGPLVPSIFAQVRSASRPRPTRGAAEIADCVCRLAGRPIQRDCIQPQTCTASTARTGHRQSRSGSDATDACGVKVGIIREPARATGGAWLLLVSRSIASTKFSHLVDGRVVTKRGLISSL
jgi:hypothetical protein